MLSEPIAGQRVVNAQTVAHGDDTGLYVTFYAKAVPLAAKSELTGKPEFKDVDFVRIITPGDALNIYDQPVMAKHKERFARQWAAYQAGKVEAQDGTPLEAWVRMTPSKIAAYKASNVFTVEGVANIADSNASHMPMDWMDDRLKARAYLQSAEDSAYAQRVAAESAAKDEEIARLKANLADLGSKVDALMAAEPAPKARKA